MSSEQDIFSEYPSEVQSSTQQPTTVYTRLPGYYAVRHHHPDTPSSESAITTMGEGEDTIEVFLGEVGDLQRAASLGEVSPVYAIQPGGAPAIPTGRVFIRFKNNVAVEDRIGEIEQAGYEIAQRIEYAPHAAWLRARSGAIADALTGVKALEKIANVENIEPQMLMKRVSR
ncbi:MAG TPA: hypothetical protein VJ810_20435 [Blastocatellia bacterium]|nr:hypothetical protein [Blastocatellia bacterium]